MRSPLIDFLEEKYVVDDLLAAATVRVRRSGTSKSIVHIEPVTESLSLEVVHLIRLCDLAIGQRITAEELSDIAFWIQSADELSWESDSDEGRVISETLFQWACPEINFPLTRASLGIFRERLMKRDLSIPIK